MTYYGLPDEKWKDNPWMPGRNNLQEIQHINSWLVSGAWANHQVAQRAQFMRPEEALRYQQWALAHPTVNPRTWGPLAKAGIDPYSDVGQSVAAADISSSVYQRSYDKYLGQKQENDTPPGAAPDPVQNDNPWGPDWLVHGVGDVVSAGAGMVAGTAKFISEAPQTYLRGAFTGLSASWQGIVAEGRTNLGAEQHRAQLAGMVGRKSGLSPDATKWLREVMGAEGSSLYTPEEAVAKAREMPPTGVNIDQWNQALDLYSEAAADPSVLERLQGSGQNFSKVFQQTDLGVAVQSLTDGTKGNFFTGTPEPGSKYDPKTKTWINADGEPAKWVDYHGIFVPQEAQQESEMNAIMAYDMRTPEQVKNGVAPLAWTPGRGLAATWYDPDSTSFYLVSGLADAALSLTGDPVNLIPVGAASKAIKASTTTGRAFAGAGEDIVVLSRGFRFGPGGVRLPAVTEAARTGAVDSAKRILAEEGQAAKAVVDPSLGADALIEHTANGARVVRLGSEEGLVNLPHVKYVLKDATWQWLNSAKGQRVVDDIAQNNSAYDIWNRMNQKVDFSFAQQMAKASTPEEVRALLGTRIGFDITDARQLGKLGGTSPVLGRIPLIGDTLTQGFGVAGSQLEGSGLFTRAGRSAFARMNEEHGYLGALRSLYRTPFRLAPSSGVGFSLHDVDSAAEELSRFARGTRIPENIIAETMNALAETTNPVQRYQLIYGINGQGGMLTTIARDMLLEQGYDPEIAHMLSRGFAGGIDPSLSQYVTSDLGPTAFGTKDGLGTLGRPHYLNEMFSQNVHLPNYRSLRRATGVMGKISKSGKTPEEVSRRLADAAQTITSTWRDLVLMRPAYMLREVGEMAFSMSLAGGPGLFTRPDMFIANAMQAGLAMHFDTMLGKAMARTVSAPLRGARHVTDSFGRVLTRNADERAVWQSYATLPDEERPDILKGLTHDEITALYNKATPYQRQGVFWANVDKKAMADYLMTHEGAQYFMPQVSRMARLNGTTMWNELWQIKDGKDVRIPKFQYELNRVSGNMVIDEEAVRKSARHLRPLLREQEAQRRTYARALIAQKLAPLQHDEMTRRLADPKWTHETIVEAWRGTPEWQMSREMEPDLWGDPSKPFEPPSLENVTVGDDLNYVMGNAQNLQLVTGQDAKLIEAIRTGKFEGKPLDVNNGKLVDHVVSLLDDDAKRGLFPEILHDIPYDKNLRGAWKKWANDFFETTGEFSDLWSRAPMIRHYWTDRIIEMSDDLTPSARLTAAANLRKAGDYKLARKVLASGKGKGGTLTIEEADMIASGYARRKTAQTFYNAHRRQNYAVSMRILAPFIQSTFNTIKRWGAMAMVNPHLAYRTLKPIQALRDPGSAVIYEIMGNITGDEAMQSMYSPGHPEASVNGFFFTNQYGQRVFAFPGIRNIYNLLPGPDVPQGNLPLAQAGNLNVAGQSWNPGFGPLLTLPANLLFSDDIYQDNWKGSALRMAFPYGLSDESGLIDKLMNSLAPTAVKRAISTPEEQANMAVKLFPTLMATGNYDITTMSGQRTMIADAMSLTTRLGRLDWLASGTTPTTFQWAQAIDVTDGDKAGGVRMMMLQDRLAQEWRKYTAAKSPATASDDYANGALRFLGDYGLFAFYSVMPRTQTNEEIPVTPTADIWEFRTNNPDAYDRNRNVIALFFPGGDPQGEWSDAQANLYRWQKVSGERTQKTPDDFLTDANRSLGWIMYGAMNQQLARLGISGDEETVIRAQIANDIAEKFPGWTNEPMDTGTFKRAMIQTEEATHDPDLQTLPGTPYIATYLEARKDAITGLQEQGYAGDLSASYASVERANLAALAGRLAAQDSSGTFSYAWGRLFSSEFEGG